MELIVKNHGEDLMHTKRLLQHVEQKLEKSQKLVVVLTKIQKKTEKRIGILENQLKYANQEIRQKQIYLQEEENYLAPTMILFSSDGDFLQRKVLEAVRAIPVSQGYTRLIVIHTI